MAADTPFMTYRRQAVAIAVAGFLVALVTMACGWLALRQFDAVQAAWVEHTERATAIGDALADLERSIGYGGFIHNFKNYVLRRDSERYVARIEADIQRTEEALERLEVLLRNPADRIALSTVRRTFAEYAANFRKVEPLIRTGADRGDIDAVVKVDDGPALTALARLGDRAVERTRVAEARARETHSRARWYLIAGAAALVGAVVLGTVTMMSLVGRIVAARREVEEALRRQLAFQDELVQAEKMAALGGLVAGVAHEINTPVGISLTAATHLEGETGKVEMAYQSGNLTEEGLSDYFKTAKEAARLMVVNSQRASDLTQSFKQVAVDQTGGERRHFNLAGYIDEILSSLRPQLKKTPVEIQVDCPRGLVVDSHPGAFSQVLTNLVMNALTHAYEPGRAGRVRIAVSPENTGLTIRFEDDGKGILPEHRDKVFEPFFTTRRGSGGSGLGLHILHNIVTQTLKGTVRFESEVGKGTRFILRIPYTPDGLAVAVVNGGKSR